MSRDAITELEQARQKKQIEQTLEEASWDIPRLLKINARLVKEKHAQAEQLQDTRNTLKRAFKKFCLDDENIGSQEITSEIIKVLPTKMLDGEGLDDE